MSKNEFLVGSLEDIQHANENIIYFEINVVDMAQCMFCNC